MIQYFKVYGLYGTKNVCLKFAPTVTVIVGMNGSGKTTLLNMLHCCLDKERLLKLKRYEFESIEIKFNDICAHARPGGLLGKPPPIPPHYT